MHVVKLAFGEAIVIASAATFFVRKMMVEFLSLGRGR